MIVIKKSSLCTTKTITKKVKSKIWAEVKKQSDLCSRYELENIIYKLQSMRLYSVMIYFLWNL